MSTQRVIPQTGRGTLSWCLIVACGALGLLAVGPPGEAHAGTYWSSECSAENGAAPDAAFDTNSSGYSAYGCDQYGYLAITPNRPFGCNCQEWAAWTLAAPAGVVFLNASLSVLLESLNGFGAFVTLTNTSGYNYYWPSNGETDFSQNVQSPPFSASLGVTYLTASLSAYCYPTACNGQYQAWAQMSNIHLQLSDLEPPSAPALGGELAGEGIHRGTEALSVYGSDVGGGVHQALVRVNGEQIGAETVPCSTVSGGFAGSFRPCPASRDFSFSIDTEAAPWQDGQNALETCVGDYAQEGGPNWQCVSRTVTVDNSCDPSTASAPASSLSAGLKRKNDTLEKDVVVKSTEGATLEGSLGGGVAGATICVYETVDTPGQGRQVAQTVKTKGGGGFAAQLAAGPSRAVDVVYRYNNRVLEDHVKLNSEAVPTLKFRKRKLHNGQAMRFSGSIPGPYADGRAVTVQAKVGKQWRTFKQLSTDLRGNFAGRYKFKHSTLARAAYRFRVLVKQQAGYPFLAGHSKQKKLIVFN